MKALATTPRARLPTMSPLDKRITFIGTLVDPERFCAGKKSYRDWIKKAVKENLDPKELSLQIEAILEQNGWQIDSVFIER
jgi:hypothetical protein